MKSEKLWLFGLLLRCGDVERNPGPTNCYFCDKVIREKDNNLESIQCSLCEKIYHKKCSKLDTETFNIMSKIDTTWICYCCKPSIRLLSDIKGMRIDLEQNFKDLKCAISDSKKDLSELSGKMNIIMEAVSKNTEEIKKIKDLHSDFEILLTSVEKQRQDEKDNKLNGLNNPSDATERERIKIQVEEIHSELDQLKQRENNLIIFNSDELHEDDDVLLVDDTKLIENILKSCSMACKIESCQIKRIGYKNSAKKRPILLRLPTKGDKWILFGRRFNLVNVADIPKEIRIQPDRTESQRQNAKLLREELIRRRKNNENVVIYKDRIVEKSRKIVDEANSLDQ